MPELALPMSKAALDRLGARLATSDQINDDDRESLVQVVAVYQQVLDDVKAQLTALGHEATTRVKTTGTLIEKLRRESVRLSQVQDLAGARIIVPDRPTQDDVAANIRSHFEASGHSWREVDRRKDPRYGYRALHLVLIVAPFLIEVQIRTEFEDTWAQILEGLADQWGRGIRYGDPPADPDTQVRAGQQIITRRETVAALIKVGEAIGNFELGRGTLILLAQAAKLLDRLAVYADQLPIARDPRPIAELPAEEQAVADMMTSGLAMMRLPGTPGTVANPQSSTIGQVFQVVRAGITTMQEESDAMLSQLRASEQELRDTLQLIASVTSEGA